MSGFQIGITESFGKLKRNLEDIHTNMQECKEDLREISAMLKETARMMEANHAATKGMLKDLEYLVASTKAIEAKVSKSKGSKVRESKL